MVRLLGTLFRWCLNPLLAALVLALGEAFFRSARTALDAGFLLGFGGGILFRGAFRLLSNRLGKDDPFEFIDTLEHELTHALMGYLTLCPPVSLSATLKSGGEVELKGANPLAVLAPYFLPLWCLLAALLGLAVKPGLQHAWDLGLFFLMGCFLWRLCLEYRWRQTDLHAYGFAFSSLLAANLLILSAGLLLWMRGIGDWSWLPAAGGRFGRTAGRIAEWIVPGKSGPDPR